MIVTKEDIKKACRQRQKHESARQDPQANALTENTHSQSNPGGEMYSLLWFVTTRVVSHHDGCGN